MHKRKPLQGLFWVIVFLLCSSQAISQNTNIQVVDSTSQNSSKFRVGVGFGLSFVGGTNISIAPNVTYAVSEKIAVGIGLQGSYTAIKDLQKTTTLGGNLITSYSPIPQLTTLLEFVELNVSTKTETPEGTIDDDYWDTAIFAGAGWNITEKISVGAKFNFLYDKDESVYTSPVIPFVNITF